MTKQILYKSLGRTNLRWSKLDEVLLDVEINMNNRLLTYIEEDIQIFKGKMTKDKEEDLGWQNWRRWQQEYVTTLRERSNMQQNSKAVNVDVGGVVMVKVESKKKKEKWKIFIISELFQGKDDQIQTNPAAVSSSRATLQQVQDQNETTWKWQEEARQRSERNLSRENSSS